MPAQTAPLGGDEIIALLKLRPHPEGGHFRETFRDAACSSGGRAASSAIYFLLKAGECARWHRVDAAEVWHWYGGASLELRLASDAGQRELRLGPALAAGERPQAVVPAGVWQRAVSLGAFTLVGCTVAPAFEFAGFEMAPVDFAPSAAKG
jgi:predicted cupin superfamily sugar epimerase